MSSNPYKPPQAAVSDLDSGEEFQEVRMWSASGRLGRLRYLAYTTGAYMVAAFAVGILTAVLGRSAGATLGMAAYLALLVFCVLVAIQRSHDMNWSGWTILLSIIPFVGLIWLFKPGTDGENEYGYPPPPNTTGVKILACLMPALVILGVLAAIAIPAYVEYTKRAAGG
jgi:uncharacterized membrane protein YhaH (DUF805 family)